MAHMVGKVQCVYTKDIVNIVCGQLKLTHFIKKISQSFLAPATT